MGENGETIEIGTVVQHPFARPPLFFFLFNSAPNKDTRRTSRDDAMCQQKKKGGGGVNKVRFGTFGNSSERFFNRML